jgi:hypothetical protein
MRFAIVNKIANHARKSATDNLNSADFLEGQEANIVGERIFIAANLELANALIAKIFKAATFKLGGRRIVDVDRKFFVVQIDVAEVHEFFIAQIQGALQNVCNVALGFKVHEESIRRLDEKILAVSAQIRQEFKAIHMLKFIRKIFFPIDDGFDD